LQAPSAEPKTSPGFIAIAAWTTQQDMNQLGAISDVLFVKTSSMGDVIHHMPAVTEAARHRPDARIAWVVEESFAPLVALHPAVARVVPVATRRWRRVLWQPGTWREMRAVGRMLRAQHYDIIIDSQGLLRSAVIAKLARGPRHGYDAASVRERSASSFYDVRHSVDRTLHAIARNRLLTGRALGYVPAGPPDYGLDSMRTQSPERRTAVLLHATARADKQWSAQGWQVLAQSLSERGFDLLLPSGNEVERARSVAIAGDLPRVRLLHREPLDRVAGEIAAAALAVGVDTGLLHLAAALRVPLVGIFLGASDPRLTGPLGTEPIKIVQADRRIPTADDVAAAVEAVLARAD
jgi:heptosyltransferase I